jgi:muconate cycloisomerase
LGYGESTPTTYLTGETSSTVVQVIKDCVSPLLFSHEVYTRDDIESLIDELESECLNQNILHYNSALGAIDIALLDALGKYQELPITNFLGSIIRERAPYSISVPFLPFQKIKELFLQLPKSSVKYVKVLVGEDESENIKRVKLIRSLFGDHVDIRVENNGKWTFQQAVSNLEKLVKYNISAVEQPVAKDDIQGLQKLKKTINIPIVVDESMCSLSDAKKLIEKQACDILNIKISKCGGLLKSRRIAQFAQSNNISCQMGAHIGETEILKVAGDSFALTTPNLVYFEGASFLLFEETYSNNQFEIKNKREDRISNFGLGIKLTNQQLIMKHCLPIVELSDKTVHSSEVLNENALFLR